MQQIHMKRTAIALGVAAAFGSAGSFAADLSGTIAAAANQFVAPTKTQGTPTLQVNKAFRIVIPVEGAAKIVSATDVVTFFAVYFDNANLVLAAEKLATTDAATGNADVTNTLGGGTFVIGALANAQTATKVGLFAVTDETGDFYNATRKVGLLSFAAGSSDTNMAITATASTALLATKAVVVAADIGTINTAAAGLGLEIANKAFNIDANYNGPVVIGTTASNSSVTVLTNVGVSNTVTSGQNLAANFALLKVFDGLDVVTGGVFAGNGSANIAHGARSVVFGTATNGNGINLAGNQTNFNNPVNKLQVKVVGALTDLAGNQGPLETVYTSWNAAAPALASGTGKLLVTTSSSTAATLWTAQTTKAGQTNGTIDVVMRFAEPVNAANFFIAANSTTTNDFAANGALTISPTFLAGTNQMFTSVTVPAGNSTDVNFVLNIPNLVNNASGTGPAEFGFDKATGALLVTTDDWATSQNVAIGFTNVANKGGTKLTSFSTHNQIAANVANTTILAGHFVPALTRKTLDTDKDGNLDGFTVDTGGVPVTGTAGANLAAGHGVSMFHVTNSGTTFNSSASLRANTNNVPALIDIILSNKVNENWDGVGTSPNAVDQAQFTTANFGTGLIAFGTATGNIRFDAQVGGVVGANSASTPITYAGAYRVTDGGALPLFNIASATKMSVATVTDGAPPVMIKAEYTATQNIGKSNELGTITMFFSETVEGAADLNASAGEVYIDGRPASLQGLNADAGAAAQEVTLVDANATDSQFEIRFFPLNLKDSQDAVSTKTVLNAAVTFPLATKINITDSSAGKLEAIVSSAGVTTKAPSTANELKMTKAKLASTYVQGVSIPTVIVEYSANVALPTGVSANAAVLDGLFRVRADVGQGQGTGTDAYFYDIKASDISVGAASLSGPNTVTLAMPANNLPANTTALHVDYRGNVFAATEQFMLVRGDNANVAATNEATAFDVAGVAAVGTATPDGDDNTRTVTLFDGTAFKALQFGNAADPTDNFLTMTIRGTAKRAGADLAAKTGVRADLVRIASKETAAAVFADPGVVGGAGTIIIRRNNPDPTGFTAGGETEMAVLNKCVQLDTLSKLLTDRGNYLKAAKAVQDAAAQNQPVANLNTLRTAAFAAAAGIRGPFNFVPDPNTDVAATINPNLGTVNINCFVELSTGVGGKGTGAPSPDTNTTVGDADASNNEASVGRTATLLPGLPNTVKNGTTTYAVRVNANTGAITARDDDGDTNADNAVKQGSIGIRVPVLAAAATTATRLEVLDTAFSRVAGGKYQLVVGLDSKKMEATTTKLDPASSDVFVLLSVKDPATGEFTLLNSAEDSFTSYTAFQQDLARNGTSVQRDLDLDLVSVTNVKNAGAWELLGIRGVAARTAAAAAVPLDLNRLFITLNPADGVPATAWFADGGVGEVAFGLGGGKQGTLVRNPNQMQLAYSLGGGIDKSKQIQFIPGMGLAFRNSGASDARQKNPGDGFLELNLAPGANNDQIRLHVPLQTTTLANATITGSGWHLVTAQVAETLAAFQARNTAVEAVVIPVSGAVTPTVGAFSWFKDAEATVPTYSLAKGTAMFVYVKTATPTGTATLDYTP